MYTEEKQRSLEKIYELMSELQTELFNLTGSELFNPQIKKLGVNKKRSFEESTSKLLHNLGIPSNIKGYEQIKFALIYLNEQKEPSKIAITKQLYPVVAANYSTTLTSVERNMRHAIKIACQRGDFELLKKIFPTQAESLTLEITNSEFIFRILEYIQKGY